MPIKVQFKLTFDDYLRAQQLRSLRLQQLVLLQYNPLAARGA